MSMTTELELAQREKFEAWAEEASALPWGYLKKRRNPSGGGYSVQVFTYMWTAWQAASSEMVEALEARDKQIAELKEEPDILEYDADAHSGYVEPVSLRYTLPEVIDENLVEGLRLLQCMLDDYRERNYGHAHEWIRHIDRKFAEHSESHEDDAYSIFSSLLQGKAEPVSQRDELGWVACSERMPDDEEDVLCFGQYGDNDIDEERYQFMGWLSSKGIKRVWRVSDGDSQNRRARVTHWMPLPAAPQQEVK